MERNQLKGEDNVFHLNLEGQVDLGPNHKSVRQVCAAQSEKVGELLMAGTCVTSWLRLSPHSCISEVAMCMQFQCFHHCGWSLDSAWVLQELDSFI